MKSREYVNSPLSEELRNPKTVIEGGYPYSTLSVSALARNMNNLVYGNPDGPVEDMADPAADQPASPEADSLLDAA